MIEKDDLNEITKMLLTVQKEMMSEMAKMFLTIEKEHFKENELWICKGRRLQMTNIVNHMKICLQSIDKDIERKVSTESVLNTTIGAMKSLVDVCEEELRTNPNLIAGEIEVFHLVEVLNDNGVASRLPHQAQYLGMSFLAEDDDLAVSQIILLADALLQLQHHRTGSIDNLDVVLVRQLVGGRWLTMGTQQYLNIVQLRHLLVVDGDETHLSQTVALHSVMHNIT